MQNADFPKARSRDLVILTRPVETLVYDMVSNEAHCLNETAAFVWSQCSGQVSVGEIARSAGKRFGAPVSDEFVSFALAELHDRKLMSSTGLSGRRRPSRREAIRKIGLASAVAVPIIASVIAPPAAHANSCVCTNPGNCINGLGCPPPPTFCNPLGTCVPTFRR
jgi:hypothetical protein